ncbi:MAG: translation initiation factor IF-2, partial [Rhodospirillales bacterium]
MTDTNDQDGGKLRLARPKLELKKTVEAGQIRQSFSHGRSKAVAVEVRKKRTIASGTAQPEVAEPLVSAPAASAAPPPAAPPPPAPEPAPHHQLTDDEKQHRLHALQAARKAEEETRKVAQIRAEEEARLAEEERERKSKLPPEPEASVEQEAPAAARPAAEAQPAPAAAKPGAAEPARVTRPAGHGADVDEDDESSEKSRRPGRGGAAAHKPPAPT